MNRFACEQNAMAGFEEMKMVDSVVCPKPRRLSALNPSLNDSIRPFRYFNHYQSEIGESQAASELLDLILIKGDSGGGERSIRQLASSPPFFSGSPPSRASNPVIQDEQFGNSKVGPFSPVPMSAGRNGGCVRMKSGDKPVAVRIEGFDCLSRDRRNCSIPSVA